MTLDEVEDIRRLGASEPPSVSAVKTSTDPPLCQVFAFLLSFVLMSLTCAFGFVGNYLSVVTLNRDRSLRTSVTKFLLTVLAVADMAFLVPVVFVIMIPAYCAFPLMGSCIQAVQQAIPYVEQYGWALASTAHMCTVYITVLVAVHRFVHVCRPHDNDRLSGLRRAKVHVACVPLFAFLYNLPRVFEYRLGAVVSSSSSSSNVTNTSICAGNGNTTTEDAIADGPFPQYTLEFSAIGDSYLFKIAYKNVSFYLFMYLVPLTTLVFVTFRLIATVRMRRNKKNLKSASDSPGGSAATATAVAAATTLNRRQQSRDDNVTIVLINIIIQSRDDNVTIVLINIIIQSRDDNVTIVLIIIIAVFIVCQTPTLVQRFVLARIGSSAFQCGHPYYYIEKISDYLAIFNSCVNFVVYVIFAPRFRRILIDDVLSGGGGGGNRRCRPRGSADVIVVVVGGGRTGRYGTGGSDYCSEMADCFGVSSSQQINSSKENAHQLQQQQQLLGAVSMKNMLLTAGASRSETTPNGNSAKVDGRPDNSIDVTADGIDRNEISSSVSSAGSSSLLPALP